MFEQTLNPTGHLWLTVLAALIPLLALILMLAVLRMTAWLAAHSRRRRSPSRSAFSSGTRPLATR